MIRAPVKEQAADTPTTCMGARESREAREAREAPDSWPLPNDSGAAVAGMDVFGVATAHQKVMPQVPKELGSGSGEGPPPDLVEELKQSDPHTARRLADAAAALPEAGAEFCGFRLLVELGRGAFARVFLAQQGDLARRLVVLKVSPTTREEPQRLPQLQHTNVRPICSVHRSGKLQAVCMPFFGAATLATVLRELRSRKSLPNSGMGLVDTLVNCRSTVRGSGLGSAGGLSS